MDITLFYVILSSIFSVYFFYNSENSSSWHSYCTSLSTESRFYPELMLVNVVLTWSCFLGVSNLGILIFVLLSILCWGMAEVFRKYFCSCSLMRFYHSGSSSREKSSFFSVFAGKLSSPWGFISCIFCSSSFYDSMNCFNRDSTYAVKSMSLCCSDTRESSGLGLGKLYGIMSD